MSIKCLIGFHNWDYCTCTVCGKNRGEQHNLTKDCEKCSKCGTTFENNHDWTLDCQKCSKCGQIRNTEHDWSRDCEKCSKCSKTRVNQHQMVDGICKICSHGTFTDERDGKTYKVIRIGNQVVMAENFAKIPSDGYYSAYEKDLKNVVNNGYLYDWDAVQNIAPKGWHLPSKEEWEILLNSLSDNSRDRYDKIKAGGSSCFENSLSGWRYTRGNYSSLGASSHYWSSTKEGEKEVWTLKVNAYNAQVEMEKCNHRMGLSLRLFKD